MGRLEGNPTVAALRYQDVHLFSDLALHGMGPGRTDDLSQGVAKGDESRTALLGRLGPRLLFLHKRTHDLVEAMQAPRSADNSQDDPSETNQVINGISKARRSEIHCRCNVFSLSLPTFPAGGARSVPLVVLYLSRVTQPVGIRHLAVTLAHADSTTAHTKSRTRHLPPASRNLKPTIRHFTAY